MKPWAFEFRMELKLPIVVIIRTAFTRQLFPLISIKRMLMYDTEKVFRINITFFDD